MLCQGDIVWQNERTVCFLYQSLERKVMKLNEGVIDRSLRIIVGVVLIGLTLTAKIGVWGWIGIVPLVTGLMGWCPLYTLLGFKTCKTK